MKKINFTFLFTMLMSMVGLNASAYDIAVENADGVTIYYNYINNNTELEVTYAGPYTSAFSNDYTGNVVIPKSVTYNNRTYSVTSIGGAAFESCSGLTSVTVPNSVTSIGNYAFESCSGLTSINIPNSVTSIGSGAFSVCSGLTSIEIPNSVTSIGGWAFSGCSKLTSINIPNSVTSIGMDAFYKCSGLTSITIPNSVTSIGGWAFSGCSGLQKVIVPDIAAWCGIEFGSLSANPLSYAHHLYSDDNTEITELLIPDGVTSIGNWAFYSCSGLTSITIPNSVTSIGSYAFNGCSGLTSITIPSSVTTIGEYAFDGCSGLTLVECNIGKAFNISSNTFSSDTYNNAELRVPRGLSSMYKQAEGWKNFKSITEGDLRICGDNLTYTYSEASGKLTIQGTGAMYDYSSSSPAPWNSYKGDIITIVIEDGATSVGSYAFSDCNSLYSVTFGKDVKTVGSSAFSGCSGLQKVIAPDIAAWCGIKFGNETANPLYYVHHLYSDKSTEITELVIPDGVTSIGSYAFYNCSGLTSITIPNSVTSIGNYAFESCSGLTSITIPNSVTSIGNYAFESCSGLTSVTIPNSMTSIGGYAFENCSDLTSVTIGSGVTSIGSQAFEGCTGLTSVTINSNAILSKAYTSSSNLSNIFGNQVKQYIIGNSVTSIGGYAFYGCSGLTSIEIPNSVTSIGSSAFSGCSKLTSINIPNSVTSIGNSAFDGCSGLTSITIPNSVTSIGSEAFNGCSGLKKVIVPDIVAWCGIKFGNNPLNYAHHLYSDDNTEITKLAIPDGVASIGNWAFWGCSSLTSITIPNSVTSIGEYAFESCSGLTSVTIGTDVTSIESTAFNGCSKLASVKFHCNNVGTWFSGLSSVKEVWIEKEVTSIAQQSFAGCSGLQSVYNNAEDVFTIAKNTFDDATYSSAKLYVPTGMKATYEETPWWLNFNKMEEYDFPTGITIPQQSKDVKVVDAYQINGLKTGSMQKGLNILKMSDGTTIKVVK